MAVTKLAWPRAMIVVLLAVTLGACQTTGGQKQTGGTLLGAGLGALAGSQIGSGRGQLVAVAVGALGGALLGTLYLFIAIGLFGQSRFTLFLAILFPALACWLELAGAAPGNMTDLQLTGLAINACVIGSSAYILWRVRQHHSV